MAKITARGALPIAKFIREDGSAEMLLTSDGRLLKRIKIGGKFEGWKVAGNVKRYNSDTIGLLIKQAARVAAARGYVQDGRVEFSAQIGG